MTDKFQACIKLYYKSPPDSTAKKCLNTQMSDSDAGPVCVCVLWFHVVLTVAEETLLPDCQDVSHPDQSVLLSSPWQRHQGHARLQEGRARYRGGQTLPQPRARTGVQWWCVACHGIFKTLHPPVILPCGPTECSTGKVFNRHKDVFFKL